MTEIVMRRRGSTLECPDQGWADILCELPEGIDLNVKATRARSLKQLGTYWGLLSFVVEHGPEWIGNRWQTKDELSDALQLQVGFVRQISLRGLPEGITYAVPASKSFAECSQERFNRFFESVQAILSDWCGFDPVPAYQEWLRQRGGSA
jgi:hypothetical protein